MATAKTAKASTTSTGGTFTAEERAAMKDRAAELRAEQRRGKAADKAAEDAQAVLDKIAELGEADRALAEGIHELVGTHAPGLAPRLWYGMPAYTRDGKVVCFFKAAEKFKARYATLGFEDAATLDDGHLWPTTFAVTALGATERQAIADLLQRATR